MRFPAAAGGASALLAVAALLTACGSDEPQPGPVSQGEQRALSDAAEMLDDRPPATPAATPTATATAESAE